MEVYIAEKPSLARAIADGLGVKRKEDAHIVCEGGNLVTWCFGHILQDCMPEDYDPAWKDWRRLPVIPQEWRLKPDEDSRKQLMAIGELLQKADAVVHAGDPDREGQAIVDEVLEYFHWRGPTRRLWLASLDALSVKKALGSMKDNAGYAHLRDAAIARRRADWLVGLNMTRALTNIGRDCGHAGKLSAGRVQSAVLNLVVTRDRERAMFTPQEYLVLQASFSVDGGAFLARFRPGDTQAGLDAEGRLVDMAAAEAVMASVRGQVGRVVTLTKTPKQKNAPLPFSLSALQKTASAVLSMTAKEVLQAAQSLYEKKLTTYPRTDCRYLPVEQLGDAARILGTLASVPDLEDAAKGADVSRKSGAWDTGKVTAHHAIIPTGEIPGNLTEKERAIYQMIARAYIMQFYGPFRCETQKLTAEVAKTLWDASGRLTLDPGWTVVGRDEEEDEKEEEQALPAVSQGDAVTCADMEPLKKKTSPPARWTEGTLIEAMANVHRFVPDVQAKAVLKENEGIGTEATRADALEKLKEAGYIKADGKALVSTRLGGQVADILPDALKDPVTTAQWERRLTDIAAGRDALDDFMEAQVKGLPELLASLEGAKIQTDGKVFPCPVCGKPLFRRTKDRDVYWECRRNELHPDDKAVFLPDDRGRPLERNTDIDCPDCGKAKLQRFRGTRKADGSIYDFFKCPGCEATFANQNGTPVRREKREKALSEHVCPDCGKPLAVREGVSKSGRAWTRFDCTGFPACKKSWWGKDGAPDFDSPVETKGKR